MKTRGAVIRSQPGEYEIIDLVLDDPRQDEVLIELVAAGLCHTDDHAATGDMPIPNLPMLGGHEGAGVVREVGPNTKGFEVGDHVVFSFLPGCGRCRWCASGMQNLCDLGANILAGSRFDDVTSFRFHTDDGAPVAQLAGLGTFAEHTVVDVNSVVRVDPSLSLEALCLLGCAVGTGWGSAVHSGNVRPGDVVLVMGVGGVGINAVQGAALAGARKVVAVDPVAFKRDTALKLGATDAFACVAEALPTVHGYTGGQGADIAIVTVGVTTSEHIGEAYASIRKAGTLVLTGVGNIMEVGMPIPWADLVLSQKRVQGSLFGACSPSWDILKQAQLYQDGLLKLDELITRRYSLDQIAEGYRDLHKGVNIRGIVVF
jgi:S-(hydroxymethyl)glutathione dehydrogenase/alcohol dehydrogenase